MFNKPLTLLSVISIFLPCIFATPASADPRETFFARFVVEVDDGGIIHDYGAANRILAAELLRTLSQQIPAAVCSLANQIDIAEAGQELRDGLPAFDRAAEAILNGDEDLGIVGAEMRPRLAHEIEKLIADWAPIHDAAQRVLDNPSDTEAAHTVYAAVDPMLEQTYHLLAGIEGAYSNPVELLQSDALLLEVSGRMAMMTSRMAYEACRVATDGNDDMLITALRETMQHFEFGLHALRDGAPELGVQAAPTEEIANTLESIASEWTVIDGHLQHVIAGNGLKAAEQEQLYHLLVVELHHVDALEHMYETYAKRVY